MMKRVLVRAFILALLVSMGGCASSNAQTEVSASFGSRGSQVDVSYFYDNLSDDGEWFEEPNYGWVWTPYDMSADWRPYYNGHWEYTDYGWSWASNERWGWATYHYGRWLFDDAYGWVWVPGTEWAPAWVAWRYGGDYVGWAPLPPDAGWNTSIGLSYSNANSIPSHDWIFVPQRNMLDINIRLQVTSISRNVTLLARSTDATRFEVRGGRPANLGIDVALVEKSVQRPVRRTKIVDVDAPARGNGRSIGNDGVGYYRPAVQPAAPDQGPAPAVRERRNSISDATVQRQHAAQQRRLESDLKTEQTRLARDQQNEMRSQAKGPAADEVRQRHAAEQQAYTAHAAQQRQVLEQRSQRKVVRPDKGAKPAKAAPQAKAPDKGPPADKGQPQDKGQGQDKGQTQDPAQDKGNGNGGK